MNITEELLNKRWIIKKDDPALYYKIKDSLKEIKKVMQEKFGYIITVNPYLIKLEKIPGLAEPWMGITEFSDIQEYQMLCYILMFLEDKEREEQFVLSSLTDYLKAQKRENPFDWTHFTTRRHLVKVIKYCMKQKIIITTEGDEDKYAKDMNTEILYENTGTSHYFMRNFMVDIMSLKTPKDFEDSEWINMDEDRGIIRRQRVYRRLLLSPGVYREESNNEDFSYIRHYYHQIESDFTSYFPCELHLHSSGAYLNLLEECAMGKVFPYNHTISDLILFIHHKLNQLVRNKTLHLASFEQIVMSQEQFLHICENVIKKHMMYLPKKYQETGLKQLTLTVKDKMEEMGFLKTQADTSMIILYPIIGKLSGNLKESGGL